MTVSEMLDKMPITELIEWQAFYKIEKTETENARAQKQMMNNMIGKKGRRARY